MTDSAQPQPARLTTRTFAEFLSTQGDGESQSAPPIFDVVIVGSGYGGSVAAHVLGSLGRAEKLKVVLLERGKAFHAGDFPSTFAELPRELRVAHQETGQVSGHEGLFDIRLGPDVAALVANGVGGGSLINAGVMLDPNPEAVSEGDREPVLKPRLEQLLGTGVFKRVRRLLGGEVLRNGRWVRNNADRLPEELRKLKAFRQVARDRGSRADAVDITVGLDGGPNHAGTLLAPCNGCGDCMTGCNVGAKDSHDRNLLLETQRRMPDFDIVTGATVTSVMRQNGHWELRVLHTDARLQAREASAFRVRAARIVLATGALGSPEILMRSRTDELVLSASLGESFSGNGDDIAAIHRLDQELHSTADEDVPLHRRNVGPTTTARVELKGRERPFLLEEFSIPGPIRRLFEEVVTTGYTMSRLPRGDCSVHGDADHDPLAVDPQAMARTLLVGVIGHDDARGSLRLARPERPIREVPQMGTLRIHWPDARWGRELDAAHDELLAFAEKRGAKPAGAARPILVANPMWRLLPDGLDTLVSQPRGPVLTVHPLGGCRMGADFTAGVVDRLGRVYDVSRPPASAEKRDDWFGSLLVLDGSIIGASLGVNPALTIASLALAAMEELLATDAGWQQLGAAGPDDPPTLTDHATLPAADCLAPPLYKFVGPDPAAPVRTRLDIFERLVSGPERLAGREWPVIIELTVALKRTPIAELIAPGRVAVPLVPKLSRLRLYDATLWARDGLKHQDDIERLDALIFEAELGGSLRFLHRGVTRALPRTLHGLGAWLGNRGWRDLWQQYADPYITADGRQRRAADMASRPRDTPSRNWYQQATEFINLASHAGQKRRFDYALTIGRTLVDTGGFGPLFAEGRDIHGEKRLRYERRCNPWKQLTQMSLTDFPGLSLSADRPEACPVLKLDARHLARLGLPLLQVGSQRNHAEALAELLSLGLYLLRVLIDVHLWSFRKPDRREPREARRLPLSLPGMPAPQITWLAVDKWPKDSPLEGQPVMIRLARYPLAGRQTGGEPLVMIHGYTASGTTFAHPSLKRSAAEYFWKRNRDVWVLDLRTSCGLDSARHPWAMEQAALIDIPAALLHVRHATGQHVDVLAHCIGGAMLSMALLADAALVHSGGMELGADTWLSPEQLGVLTAFNGDRPPGGRHPTVNRVVLSQKGPVMRYTDENVFRAYVMQFARRYLLSPEYRFEPSRDPGVAEQLLDRLLASLPYEHADFDRENPRWPCATTPWTSTRHRVDALFGRTFTAANLRDETLEAIDDFFGPMNLDTVAQTIHFARWDAITNQRGRGEFLIRQRLRERWGGIPTLALHGADNGLVDPYTLRLLDYQFQDNGLSLTTKRFEAMGHQDSLIGTGATRVFAEIEQFLQPPPGAAAAPTVDEAPTEMVAEAGWFGPRLVAPAALGNRVRVAVMSRPDQGRGTLWLVPAYERLDAAGRPTAYEPVPQGNVVWATGDTGASGVWLYAKPDSQTVLPPIGATNAGWLCIMVYPLGETTARRLGSSPPGPKASDARGGTTTSKSTSVFGVPRGGGAFPLRSNFPQVAQVAQVAQPTLLSDAGVEWAVSNWLARQPLSTCQEVFIRADDVCRAEALAQQRMLRFAVGSCQYPAGLFDRVVAGGSLSDLAGRADNVSLALMVGDQIYADASAGLADPTRRDELYEQPHQRAFRLPEMRRVMQRMPIYMVADDHELCDNWEPLPQNLPDDEQDPRLKRLRKHLARVRRNGVAAFQRFQRTEVGAAASLDMSFEAGGHAFYLLDTRTERQRGRPSEATTAGWIISVAQRVGLQTWLQQHADVVKFIACPSLFLPRRVQTATSGANACQSDAWDGFPDSMRWLLALIEEKEFRKIVFLSGDEHHSMHSEIWVGSSRVKVVSVHSSAFYAPYPFANGQVSDLHAFESHADYGTSIQVNTCLAPPGDGYAVLEVINETSGPVLHIEYCKADGGIAVPSAVALT